MLRWITSIILLASLIGCVIPVSPSCIESQQYENPEANRPPSTSKCDATDAAVYVIAATLKSLNDKEKDTTVEANKSVKCSDMVGKSQKECFRKERALYDPLNEI